MKLFLTIAICVIDILLILSVLLQQRGAGLGRSFGGESTVYRTRRGAERVLMWATVILAILFVVVALANVLL